jgi:hypothetical protein
LRLYALDALVSTALMLFKCFQASPDGMQNGRLAMPATIQSQIVKRDSTALENKSVLQKPATQAARAPKVRRRFLDFLRIAFSAPAA